MSYRFDFHPRHVVVTVEGALSADEEIEGIRALLGSPQFQSGNSIIVDNRLRLPGADRAHLHNVADEFAAALARVKIPRLAIVASRTLSFGIGALFETIATNRELPLEVKTFSLLESAVEWVEQVEQAD